jgi:hypothetical protein
MLHSADLCDWARCITNADFVQTLTRWSIHNHNDNSDCCRVSASCWCNWAEKGFLFLLLCHGCVIGHNSTEVSLFFNVLLSWFFTSNSNCTCRRLTVPAEDENHSGRVAMWLMCCRFTVSDPFLIRPLIATFWKSNLWSWEKLSILGGKGLEIWSILSREL